MNSVGVAADCHAEFLSLLQELVLSEPSLNRKNKEFELFGCVTVKVVCTLLLIDSQFIPCSQV